MLTSIDVKFTFDRARLGFCGRFKKMIKKNMQYHLQ